jgi:phage gp36-like protein
MSVEATPVTSGDASGYYATQDDVENRFGIDNIRIWSQLDNTVETADETRIQAALDYADAYINAFFRGSQYAAPLVFATGGDVAKVWAATIAGEWLFRSRVVPEGDDKALAIAQMLERVTDDMAQCRGGMKRLDAAVADSDMPTCAVVV